MLPVLVRHPAPIHQRRPIDVSTAQGIGKAIALRLADDGFEVIVNDIPSNSENLSKVVEEIKAKGRASSAHLADVSVEEQVKEMVAEVARIYGGLDVVRSRILNSMQALSSEDGRQCWNLQMGPAHG